MRDWGDAKVTNFVVNAVFKCKIMAIFDLLW